MSADFSWLALSLSMSADISRLSPEDRIVLIMLLGEGHAREPVTIPAFAANDLVKILLSLPGPPGRRPVWSPAVRKRALQGLGAGTPIRVLAREIAEMSGQPVTSARRLLQAMEKQRAKRPPRNL